MAFKQLSPFLTGLEQWLDDEESSKLFLSWADHLPLSSQTYFELNLAKPGFDIEQKIDTEQDHLAFSYFVESHPQLFSHSSCWQHLLNFYHAWRDPNGSLIHLIRNIWLEYDQPSSQDNPLLPEPSVFISFFDNINPQDKIRAIEDTWRYLFQQQSLDIDLARFFYEDDNTSLRHVGFWLARKNDCCLRFIVKGVVDLENYLQKIGGVDKQQDLLGFYYRWHDAFDYINLAYNVTATGVDKPFGFECINKGENAIKRWQHASQRLCLEGIMSEQQKRAMLDWPQTHIPTLDQVWPLSWLITSLIDNNKHLYCIDKTIGHIKFNFYSLDQVETKVYLLLHHGIMQLDNNAS